VWAGYDKHLSEVYICTYHPLRAATTVVKAGLEDTKSLRRWNTSTFLQFIWTPAKQLALL